MTNVELSDSKLISLYMNGSEECFEVLLTRYKYNVYTAILFIVKDRYVAEDLTQDTFIKTIKVLRTKGYNEEGNFKPWLLRIARNLAIDYFRKSKRYPTILIEEGANISNRLEVSEESYESLQIKQETKEKIHSFIQELSDDQRKVIMMRHYQEMSFQSIANLTGVSINTALGRMRYALINLRKKINQDKTAYDHNIYPT